MLNEKSRCFHARTTRKAAGSAGVLCQKKREKSEKLASDWQIISQSNRANRGFRCETPLLLSLGIVAR